MVHKVRVRVVHKTVSQYATIPKPVSGAKVSILNMTQLTDFSGYAYFEFTNNSTTNFTVKAVPTETTNFVPISLGGLPTKKQQISRH